MSVPRRTLISLLFFSFLTAFSFPAPAHAGDDWLPISPEELKMTSEPKAPGAPAIYLYRQVDRDDNANREYNYVRIKIFSDAGRKYSDVQISFIKGFGDITNLKARTIQPNGSIVNFDGTVYEKTIVKAKGFKIDTKTFTMPAVEEGSILEYHYTRISRTGLSGSQWLLSEELFTKHARFSLHKNMFSGLHWSWPRGLPPGTSPPTEDHGVIRLETQDVPAFQIEDYMPPPDEMKYRVEFVYSRLVENDPDKYWKEMSKRLYSAVELFTDKRKAMEQYVAQINSPSVTPEQNLHKIYDRCQQLRNLSFEPSKTTQEREREKLKQIHNVEDVWKDGYGDRDQITWLFLALARAANFDASLVFVPTRDKHFFDRSLMNSYELNTTVVQVKLDGKDLYLAPGVSFAPFGLLPWYETDVEALRVDKEGGTWVKTLWADPSRSGVERKAALHLDESGTLEGKATITFLGLSALSLRLDERDQDDIQRKKVLEDEIKGFVPVGIEAELTNTPDWNSSSTTLVAEYKLKVPNWASSAGHRSLLATGLFGGGEKHVFESTVRVQPVYFHFPYTDVDDITITPPQGRHVINLPAPQRTDLQACAYSMAAEDQNGTLHLRRRLMINLEVAAPKYYTTLHNFFQAVRSGDEQQVVLAPESSSVPNSN